MRTVVPSFTSVVYGSKMCQLSSEFCIFECKLRRMVEVFNVLNVL